MHREEISLKHAAQRPLSIKLHMDNFTVEFPPFSVSYLWETSNWESHCKIFIYSYIHHGDRIIVYRAVTTPEPLCCGTPLVYHGLCKIKRELDPKKKPIEMQSNQQSAAKAWQRVSQEYITNTVTEKGLSIGWESDWIQVEFYQATNFEGLIGRLISFSVKLTVIGKTICF